MPSILEAHNLSRHLGEGATRVHALKGVSLKVDAGKTYSIVGHSGSGKSTLLYLLGLLDRAESGTVTLAGQATETLRDEERTELRNRFLGFVFQFHFLIKEFSVLDNVMIPMRKLGAKSPKAMRDTGMSLLDSVGLADKAQRLGNQLSGGEQQRVAIARALANNPQVVLADEPTGNLDHENADRVFELLSSISRERGNAFVMVSHNMELAKRCDVVLPMQDGCFLPAET
ncbi:MAG: ABC transporter ATP-binding protein [Opitutaceae bacterium BACL24 MAG-120322-bin51]|nr:MAG: ABC transporter ATP-binding protein [Opitutaceae bacterium BACL24 MAG-120322-bin51]